MFLSVASAPLSPPLHPASPMEDSSFSVTSLATSEVVVGEYAFLGGCACFSTLSLPQILMNLRVPAESLEQFHTILDPLGW